MIRYAHIGLPKCGSTWLQTRYFPDHPQFLHLGKFATPRNLPFWLRKLFFSDLIETSRYHFDKTEYRTLLDQYTRQAEVEQKKAIGISIELATLQILGRVDLDERAQRIVDFMGKDTRIIFLIREQRSWLTSLYCTLLKEAGLTVSFADWCHYVTYERDYGIYVNMLYDCIYQSYADRVGKENVLVLKFEDFAESTQAAINLISEFLDVSHIEESDSSTVHKKADPETLGAMLALNRKWQYALSRNRLERIGGHRLKEWYTDICKIEIPEHIDKDARRHSIMYSDPDNVKALALAECGPSEPVDLTIPKSIATELNSMLAPHNRRFENLTGLKLEAGSYAL